MTAHVLMRDLARIVLPYGSQDGGLLMLSVYFDDSGTHDELEIVVLSGVLGVPGQWDLFNELWSEKLAAPSPGKPRLSEFHMTEGAGDGEFVGWGRTATDSLVRELTDIILACDLYVYGTAIFRKDWDELVTGEMRESAGDAEGSCVRRCYMATKEWSRKYGHKPEIAFVFDNRPHRLLENDRLVKLFDSTYFNNATLTFASSKKTLPLQAADLVAWEMYQYGLSVLKAGTLQPFRPPFQRMITKSNGALCIGRC